jgi:hypothetical protein
MQGSRLVSKIAGARRELYRRRFPETAGGSWTFLEEVRSEGGFLQVGPPLTA